MTSTTSSLSAGASLATAATAMSGLIRSQCQDSSDRARPLVLFSITMGWGIRNFVHSRVFKAVSEFADIAVAASEDLVPYFESLHRAGQIAFVVELPSDERKLPRLIRQARKAILQGAFGVSTARIQWKENGHDILGRACRSALWNTLRALSSPWQLTALEQLEERIDTQRDDLLKKRPNVLVNCSPFDFRDRQLQRLLYRQGVPTISIIPSWDNPSSKGCISTGVDTVLVWGDTQKRELEKYYPTIDPACIRVAGIPQFDLYTQDLPPELDRRSFFERFSIPANSRLILYATCSERLFTREPEVVAHIADATEQNRFGEQAHVLIRCHPADRAERYRHLCDNDRVTIFPSSVQHSQTLQSWTPPNLETAVLAATLRHSEVCINTASTMTLDAFACGKPVVNIAYDGDATLPYLQSTNRYYDYHHYRPIADSGAVMLAHSREQLLTSIEESLRCPERTEQDRRSLLNEFCHRPPKGSVDFIVGEIERLLSTPVASVRRSEQLGRTVGK